MLCKKRTLHDFASIPERDSDLFDYRRTDAAAASNPFTQTAVNPITGGLIPSAKYTQFGASVGGPMVKAKRILSQSWRWATARKRLQLAFSRVFLRPMIPFRYIWASPLCGHNWITRANVHLPPHNAIDLPVVKSRTEMSESVRGIREVQSMTQSLGVHHAQGRSFPTLPRCRKQCWLAA